MSEFFEAIDRGDLRAVMRLFASQPNLLAAVDEHGQSPLNVAVARNRKGIVEFLLKSGAAVNALSVGPPADAPLHVAARHGNLAVAKLLISRGADLNQRNGSATTPLYQASISREPGGENIAKLLIKEGAAIDLRSAVRLGDKKRLEELLRGKPAPDELQHALLDASRIGWAEAARMLLDVGALVNAEGPGSYLPLTDALRFVAYNLEPVVTVLLEKGADPDMKDYAGKTALEIAEEYTDKGVYQPETGKKIVALLRQAKERRK